MSAVILCLLMFNLSCVAVSYETLTITVPVSIDGKPDFFEFDPRDTTLKRSVIDWCTLKRLSDYFCDLLWTQVESQILTAVRLPASEEIWTIPVSVDGESKIFSFDPLDCTVNRSFVTKWCIKNLVNLMSCSPLWNKVVETRSELKYVMNCTETFSSENMTRIYGVEEMVEIIFREPNLKIKKSFIGPNLILSSNYSKISFRCTDLFMDSKNEDEDVWALLGVGEVVWPPSTTVPSLLQTSFSLGGRVSFSSWLFAKKQNGGDGYYWPAEDINNRGRQPCTCGPYGGNQCQKAIDKYKEAFIHRKRGFVFGSQNPWAEAALIAAGASHVTTVEYMPIVTDHPRLSTLTPTELQRLFLEGRVEPADFVFSFSSLEHDGLGRYGDPINPFGDLESISRIHCLLKPGGVFFFSVPVGYDAVVWNAHRIYGKLRLSMILQNWEALDLFGSTISIEDPDLFGYHRNEPVWVLRKKELQFG